MANILPTTMEYFDKLLGEQLLEGEGGGGSSWQTVFEGSVTTVEFEDALLEGLTSLTADTIRVTLNGTTYTCEKQADGSYGATYDESTQEFDFSEYPFNIGEGKDGYMLATETAGTYTLKIEEEQSGGSSDFSTADVTIINNSGATVALGDVFAPIFQIKTDFTTVGLDTEIANNDTLVLDLLTPIDLVEGSIGSVLTGLVTNMVNCSVDDGDLFITDPLQNSSCTITIS